MTRFNSVQMLNRVQFFATPWTAALHASLDQSYLQPSSVSLRPFLQPVSQRTVLQDSSVQFSSVAQLCPTLCDPIDCSTPGLPVHHQLLEFTQTQVHGVSDAIQPSHPLSSPSPLAFKHLSFPASESFSNESSLHIRWPKYWSFGFSISPSNEYIKTDRMDFRIDWLDLLAVQGTLKSLLQHHSSKASIFHHSAFFKVQLLHPYLTTGKALNFQLHKMNKF